ncbi:hypothetical protein [Streptomyces sp. NPDC053048]|uniref:hypothetical protein n=1 Tax=Streptomyces sp. NPDC053048 TaxID=3365694 RepID=UPI0037D76B4E
MQMKTFIAGDKVLFDSAEVSRLLRALGATYRSSVIAEELEQFANQLDMAALEALDAQQ